MEFKASLVVCIVYRYSLGIYTYRLCKLSLRQILISLGFMTRK